MSERRVPPVSTSKVLWTVIGGVGSFGIAVWTGITLWPHAPTSGAFAIGLGAAWIGAGFGALIGMSDRG